MRTQVAIIGGGPAGMLLSHLLAQHDISSVVLERKTKDYVLSRIRAGVLEQGSVNILRRAGLTDRLDKEAFVHNGCEIAATDAHFAIDFSKLCDQQTYIYGQTELTKDLYAAHDKAGRAYIDHVENVQIIDAESDRPQISFEQLGVKKTIHCDFVAGCDGFHGVSRKSIPTHIRREFEKIYPFGWLGILSETPPVADELIYAQSENGFALASMRNENLSRYYIQVPLTDSPDDWSDEKFWQEFKHRMPLDVAQRLVTGPSIEKSIAPLRSFVSAPMRWGNLFLCGDAAHIVPPTGAKGLNLAISDVNYLSEALTSYYKTNDGDGIAQYSDRALRRVWQAIRFSWWMTRLLHRFPDQDEFDVQIQRHELAHLASSRAAQMDLAQNYAGLPL